MDGEGGVSQGDDRVNEAVENVIVRDDETLRGRCARAHLRCQDRQGVKEPSGTPVPASVPGDFTVGLDAAGAGEGVRGSRGRGPGFPVVDPLGRGGGAGS